MFDAMVSRGRMSLPDFVDLTATRPAQIYGLHPRKGAIVPGADADIVLWDPACVRTITAADLHDRTGYTPFEGRQVTGWPVTVLRRGMVIVDKGVLCAAPGSGLFLAREAGEAAVPQGPGSGADWPQRGAGRRPTGLAEPIEGQARVD
jgi:dihydropyrimidinase